jgi:hypothetical protein
MRPPPPPPMIIFTVLVFVMTDNLSPNPASLCERRHWFRLTDGAGSAVQLSLL